MLYVGVDIIEIPRIQKAVSDWGDKFLSRIYTSREIDTYCGRPQSLAVRFAAKEAVIKALDAGDKGISFKDIEILATVSGKPILNLYGSALKIANTIGILRFNISLSHSRTNAVAMVVGETAS